MEFFDKYVFDYDMKDPDINYKYYHSYRVMDVMALLANKLNLSTKDVYLAKVIGLLHDIGRFEQDKLYNDFKDGNFDHGEYGVRILRENNFLEQTNLDKEDYEVVYKAIKNHNKFAIDNNLTERELLFAKLIRDADKLDILYVIGSKQFDIFEQDSDDEISKNIENSFFSSQVINKKQIKNNNDRIILYLGYIHDINFKETFEIISKNEYYNKIYQRFNRKDIFKKYIDYVNKNIEERID